MACTPGHFGANLPFDVSRGFVVVKKARELFHLQAVVELLRPLRATGLTYENSDRLWAIAIGELAKRGVHVDDPKAA